MISNNHIHDFHSTLTVMQMSIARGTWLDLNSIMFDFMNKILNKLDIATNLLKMENSVSVKLKSIIPHGLISFLNSFS